MKKFNYSDVNIIKKKSGYSGFFNINQYTLQHGKFDGGQTRKLTRECFERGHAVGVLAYDPWKDCIILLEQFRIGAYVYEDNLEHQYHVSRNSSLSPWLLEIIAGIVEPGESPTDVAHREAEEEAGLRLLALESIGDFYSSPGGTSESTQLYCACVKSDGVGGIHGLESEGEDIRVFVVSFNDAVQLLKDGCLNNASAMIAMQWLVLNKSEIQAKWQKS
ncbi:MAG: NUDIX domain-containing protein [Gammaproteobacteria bacterium]|nr:NUDIX domain-containing protein [Gammaproteobacteria bacterium]